MIHLTTTLSSTNVLVPTLFDSVSGDVLVAVCNDPCTYTLSATLTLSQGTFLPAAVFGLNSDHRRMFFGNSVLVDDPDMVLAPIFLGRPQIGIGPSSAILNSQGPISLIKNETQPRHIALNSTLAYFVETCVSESVLTITYPAGMSAISMYGSVALANQTNPPAVQRLYLKTISEGAMLAVPREVLSRVLNSLERAGLVREPGTLNRWRNCSDSIARAPSLHITINSSNNTAALVIHPEDYLIAMPDTPDLCRLIIGISYRGVILLNPIMMNGVNFRLERWSREQGGILQLCDTVL